MVNDITQTQIYVCWCACMYDVRRYRFLYEWHTFPLVVSYWNSWSIWPISNTMSKFEATQKNLPSGLNQSFKRYTLHKISAHRCPSWMWMKLFFCWHHSALIIVIPEYKYQIHLICVWWVHKVWPNTSFEVLPQSTITLRICGHVLKDEYN